MQPQVKQRNSNLELYRIIVMLLIVAHHYVVNSGLMEEMAKELHANSDTMRQWLWRDTLQNAEQFYMSYACVHAMISVITIFAICIAIDYIRIHTLEKWMFIVIDKYLAKYKLK